MKIPNNWTFKSNEVADGFDRHVREQLPWYDLMAGAAAHIARHYIPEDGRVLDLGCSTGNMGQLLADTLALRRVDFIPVDNSPQMIQIYAGPGTPILADFAHWTIPEYDVAICFLSLMFVAPRDRDGLLSALRLQMRPGGALIIVDKAEARGGYIGTILARLTLAGKVSSGTSADEIVAKELSLIGVQRPLEARHLTDATQVFQFGEFAGWIIEA
jgi:tRNA (cmo5U34)-methyltransferase